MEDPVKKIIFSALLLSVFSYSLGMENSQQTAIDCTKNEEVNEHLYQLPVEIWQLIFSYTLSKNIKNSMPLSAELKHYAQLGGVCRLFYAVVNDQSLLNLYLQGLDHSAKLFITSLLNTPSSKILFKKLIANWDKQNTTPLLIAILFDEDVALGKLISEGFPIESACPLLDKRSHPKPQSDSSDSSVEDNIGPTLTPLSFAVLHNKHKSVKKLLELNADVNHALEEPITPLLVAMDIAPQVDNRAIIALLVEKASKVNIENAINDLKDIEEECRQAGSSQEVFERLQIIKKLLRLRLQKIITLELLKFGSIRDHA